jgi:hypothetical protein
MDHSKDGHLIGDDEVHNPIVANKNLPKVRTRKLGYDSPQRWVIAKDLGTLDQVVNEVDGADHGVSRNGGFDALEVFL